MYTDEELQEDERERRVIVASIRSTTKSYIAFLVSASSMSGATIALVIGWWSVFLIAMAAVVMLVSVSKLTRKEVQ